MKNYPPLGEELVPPGEEADTQQMIGILRKSLEKEYEPGNTKRRFHPKSHGLVECEFIVLDDIDPEWKQGLFKQPGTYKAWGRYSNCPQRTNDDIRPASRGMALKVMGVPEASAIPDPIGENTQDFLMVSNQAFSIGYVRYYRKSMVALFTGVHRLIWFLLNPFHWKRLIQGLPDRIKVANILERDWHSASPFRCGNGKAVKFKMATRKPKISTLPDNPSPNYLRERLVEDLKNGDAWYDFYIQPQTDPQKEPIEDTGVKWESPFIKVAEVRVLQQDFDTPERREMGENITFSPWHCMPGHQPLGGINRCRKAIYIELAKFRRTRNGVTSG